MKKFLVPLSVSISLVAALVLAGGGAAQATTPPEGGGGGAPCINSSALSTTGGKVKVTFTLTCYQPMTYVYHGITLQDDATHALTITRYTCHTNPCSASATLPNPSGSQTFEVDDEYYMTIATPSPIKPDTGVHLTAFTFKA